MTLLEMFAALIVAHCITDFPLQGDFLAKAKNHKAPIPGIPWFYCLMVHSIMAGGGAWLVTGSLGIGLLETAIHALTDYLKCDGKIGFYADQIVHIACKLIWAAIAVNF
jgi:hypothetical protein